MKKWILICATPFIFLNAWATENNTTTETKEVTTITSSNDTNTTGNSDTTTAKSIIENWFMAMKSRNVDQAASYLAPQFVSLHTDGKVRNKDGELDLIKHLDMKKYALSDFHFSSSGNDIVVTFKDKGIEKIDNRQISHKAAGRMAVLQKQNDNWLILAYANLDTIR